MDPKYHVCLCRSLHTHLYWLDSSTGTGKLLQRGQCVIVWRPEEQSIEAHTNRWSQDSKALSALLNKVG